MLSPAEWPAEWLELAFYLRGLLVGLAAMLAVLACHGFCAMRILVCFRKRAQRLMSHHLYRRVQLLFLGSAIGLALSQVGGILVWAILLKIADLVASPLQAVLFSGSCYTTLGMVPDILPAGWKALFIYIGLSGLFSTAWSTSIVVGMTPTFHDAWCAKRGLLDPH